MAVDYIIETIQLKRGVSTDFVSNNPTLLEGEAGYELDTNKLKIGDGIKDWNTLDYLTAETGGIPTVLSDLADVASASPANRFALLGTGTTFVSRALVLQDITDYDTNNIISDFDTALTQTRWKAIEVPTGGTINQVLAKNSGTNYDVTWQTPSSNQHVIQEEGSNLTARTNLNFIGANVTATDNVGNDATDITLSGVGDVTKTADYTSLAAISTPTNGDLVYVQADGIYGLFQYDSGSGADDGGIVISNWVRQFLGFVKASWFEDNLESAFNSGYNIICEAKTYIVDYEIDILIDNVDINLNGAVIDSDGTSATGLISIKGNNIKLHNGTIDGQNHAVSQHNIKLYGDNIWLDNIKSINSKQDAIWGSQALFATYGVTDNVRITNCVIDNPVRHGILLNSEQSTYRETLIIDNLIINKTASTDTGILISYAKNLTVNKISSDGGFSVLQAIGYVDLGVVSNCRIEESTMGSTEGFDSTFVNRVKYDNIYIKGKNTGINPSNASNNVSILNSTFDECKNGVVYFENFGDSAINNCKFYGNEIGATVTNASNAFITNCYFEECKRPIVSQLNNVDSKTNYTDNSIMISGCNINVTGESAIEVSTSLAAAYFRLVKIDNNSIRDVHTMTAAKSWWDSYTAINNDVRAISVSATTTTFKEAYITNTNIDQAAAWTTGIAGGGCSDAVILKAIDYFHLANNQFNPNVRRAVYMNGTAFARFYTDQYVETEVIDLSGSAYTSGSHYPVPPVTKGTFIGTSINYWQATSADAGVDILIRDAKSGTVKDTLTTATSQAEATETFHPKATTYIDAGRSAEIYCAGGKTGNGEVVVRHYYVSPH